MAAPPDMLQVRNPSTRRTTWIGILWATVTLCALASVTLLFVPVFIIRPFRYESPRGLLLAMFLRDRAPAGTLIAAFATLIFVLVLWKAVGRWQKGLLVFGLVIAAFCAVMSRQNHFEWMFHPIGRAEFLPQSASKLDANEMIMAVRVDNDARAYPISQMAYHHILNDVVGDVPIAVTY
jgi:amino acid transporter